MTEPPESPAAKRRRLRLITFAELIGALAVLISAASYWDSHRERAKAEVPAAKPAAIPLLIAATAEDERAALRFKPARGDGIVQTQTLSFPPALDIAAIDATGNARLDAAQVDTALRKAVPASDARPPRLPVGIVTTWEDDGTVRTDAALYEIGYTFHDRLLRGRAVEFEGITLVRRLPAAGLPAALAARWAKVAPPQP